MDGHGPCGSEQRALSWLCIVVDILVASKPSFVTTRRTVDFGRVVAVGSGQQYTTVEAANDALIAMDPQRGDELGMLIYPGTYTLADATVARVLGLRR